MKKRKIAILASALFIGVGGALAFTPKHLYSCPTTGEIKVWDSGLGAFRTVDASIPYECDGTSDHNCAYLTTGEPCDDSMANYTPL